MKRVGLTQRVSLDRDYGERRDCLDQRWTELLISTGCLPIPLPNAASFSAACLQELALDALLLTGGNDIGEAKDRDDAESAWLRHALRSAMPVLGVCRGAQFINTFLGGRLRPVSGHVATQHRLRFSTEAPAALQETDTVNSYHAFAAQPADLARDLKAFAWSEDGAVEAFRHQDLPVFGVMWHPEREEPFRNSDKRFLLGLLGES